MVKKGKKQARAYRSMAWRLILLILALWLAFAGILTWCVAADMQLQIQEQTDYYVRAFNHDRTTRGAEEDLPGAAEVRMIQSLGYPYVSVDLDPLLPIVGEQLLVNPISSDHWMWEKWDLNYGFEAAAMYYDENGQVLAQRGDYLTFSYTTIDKWRAQNATAVGKGYIVLDKLPGGGEFADRWIGKNVIFSTGMSLFLPQLRLTGYFEGNAFYPVTIDRGELPSEYLTETDPARLAQLDARGQTTWKNIFTAPAETDTLLETIYAWDLIGINYVPKEVTAGGEQFASLAELLYADRTGKEPGSYEKDSLLDAVYISWRGGKDALGDYRFALAVRCKPLQYAVLRLIWVYVISFGVTAICLWLLLRRFKNHYTLPLERMALAARHGIKLVPISRCAEVCELETHIDATNRTLAENKTQIQQLQTALDYAKDAEEKRRQLVSNITHELKTPLAVIHSYAEYLQEELSDPQQEKHLRTILEETEKMDAMVLQMLDLSRLEAGKVRLSTDRFSLPELTKAVAERMQPLFDARGLQVIFSIAEDFTVTADEARMGQVITNLLSNAQKYTAAGGDICVRIYLRGSKACFRIKNTAEHLSQEALEKVWDSFYRVDTSRSTAGTGLCLSLVKSIVLLHSGTCHVKNITMENGAPGVDFGFDLPVK